MSKEGRKRAIRIIIGIMAILILAAVLLSSSFIAAEAGHHCDGDHCEICFCISLCKTLLRQFTGAAAVYIVLFTAAVFTALVFLLFSFTGQNTLVSRKVRLNN